MATSQEEEVERPRQRNWRRKIVRIGLLLAFLLLSPFLLLRSESFRQAVLAGTASALRDGLGVAVSARDFDLDLSARRLVLFDVALASPDDGAAPFLVVPKATAELSWRDLLRAPRVIPRLLLESPTWNLDAPIVADDEASSDDVVAPVTEVGDASAVLEVHEIVIRDGAVISDHAPPGLERWFSSVRWRPLAATGSFRDGFKLGFESAPLRLEGVSDLEEHLRSVPLDLDLAFGFDLAADGRLTFDPIDLRGDGLALLARGAGRFGDGEAFNLRFDLDSQPGKLLADVPMTSELSGSGALELNRLVGTVALHAHAVPAEIVRPWLGAADSGLDLAHSMLALEADLVLGGTDPAATRGMARLLWQRAGEVIAQVDATIEEPSAGAEAVRVALEAQVLPAHPGVRSLVGMIEAPSLNAFGQLRFEALHLTFNSPDLEPLGVALERVMPGMVRALPTAVRAGVLDLNATIEGTLEAPTIDLAGTWQPSPGARVMVEATGAPLQAQGDFRVQAQALDLGRFADAWAGQDLDHFDLVAHSTGSRSVEESLAIADLDLGLNLGLSDAAGVSKRLSASGQLMIEAAPGSSMRLASAALQITGEGLQPAVSHVTVSHVTGTLRLSEGVLTFEGAEAVTGAGVLEADLRLPAASLGVLSPAVAEWVAEHVVAPAVGPLRVDLRMPVIDTAGLAPTWDQAASAPGPGFRVVGAATLTLAIDPSQPTMSTGRLHMASLIVDLQDRRLVADQPLDLMLGEGRLSLAPLRLHEAAPEAAPEAVHEAPRGDVGLALVAQAAADLDPRWQPGEDVLAALGPIRASFHTLAGPDAHGSDGPRLSWHVLADLLGIDPGGLDATAQVRVDLDFDLPRLAEARGTLAVHAIEALFEGSPVDLDDFSLSLENGELALAPVRIGLAGQLLEASARVTLDPAWRTDQPWDTLFGPVDLRLRSGPAVLGALAPRLEPMRLLAWGGDDAVARALSTNLDLQVRLDLSQPLASTGEAILDDLRLVTAEEATADRSLQAIEPLRLVLADHQLRLGPALLQGANGEAPLTLEATVDLAATWAPDAVAAEVIERLAASVHGTLDAGLLSPYLSAAVAGAAVRGPLRLDLEIAGSPGDLRGNARIVGPEAELFLARPYFTRLKNFDLAIALADGAVRLDDASFTLNEGAVSLAGGRQPSGDLDLAATFEGVRYRLDYGLSVTLDGNLTYRLPITANHATLAGEVVVERGLVRRYLDPDRQLLRAVFAGTPTVGDDASALADIELDLTVRTEDGIRVKNNLADLRASWSTLDVRGTLAAPQVVGRIDTDPNGYIFAFGQTLRLDRATLTLTGDPLIEPDLDFVITSAAEDPSVRREGASRFPASLRPEDDGTTGSATASADPGRGVADYYLDRIAGRLGGALGSLDLAIGQDLLVFGESDPTTRLTVGQDVSPHVSIAASFALRDAGDTTYVLDFHDFGRVEQLVAQVFTTDDEDQGVTLQQIIEVGKHGGDRSQPRVRSLTFDAPASVSGRGLRRAVGFGKGDRLPPGADFDIELDVAEYLRRQGYPGAEVTVTVVDGVSSDAERGSAQSRSAEGRTAELEVRVRPGPPVEIVFEGDRPPSRARRAIGTIYRPDLYEPATVEEMRQETIKALQGEGFLEPHVEVVVEVADVPKAGAPKADTPRIGVLDPDSPRKVVVRALGGQREKLDVPRFEGVDAATQALLEARFGDPRARVRWLIGDEALRRQLLATLHDLGFPAAQIDSVVLEAGRPVLRLTPGRRQTVVGVRIEGLDDALRDSLQATVDLSALEAGAPARRDVLGAAALRLERALRGRGHAAARVGAVLAPIAGDPWSFEAVLSVRGAQHYRLADIRFAGRRGTRRRWAERASRLEKGSDLREEDVASARRHLYEVGSFTAVVPRTELRDDGTGVVVFDLQERSRFRLAFGGRWASSEGVSTVVDVIDRNAFGRGVRLGIRARYAEDDQSVRGLASIPNVFGTKASLDLFVVGRDLNEDGLVTRGVNTTVQVSVPHGKHTTSRYYTSYTDQRTSQLIDLPIIGPIEIETRIELPILGFQWLRDSRDDRIEPQRGSFVSLDVSGTNGTLSSDFTYLRLLVQGQLFRRIGTFRHQPIVWAQSLRVGLADTFDNVALFRQQRFFAGGEFSVRGYEEDSLGVQEDLGDGRTRSFGGEALLVLNEELRVPLSASLLGVFFVDIGNVYPTISDLGDRLFSAVGIGVRARTPVGLLRGDIAFPLDRRESDDSTQVYLGFGYTF